MKILELINQKIVENPVVQIFYLATVEDPVDKLVPGEMPKISIESRSKVVQLETFHVSSRIRQDQILGLGERFGIDVVEQMRSVLVNEMSYGKQKRIIEKMEELGTRSWKKGWTGTQNLFNRWFGYEPMVRFSEETLSKHLMRCSREIAAASRRGEANFAILGPMLASMCKASPGFVNMQETGENAQEIVKLGHIGNLTIYLNPNLSWDYEKAILGRISKDNEEGLFYLHKDYEWITHDEPISLERIITLRERCSVVEVGNAEISFMCKRFTTKTHNLFTFLFKKLVNRIKR